MNTSLHNDKQFAALDRLIADEQRRSRNSRRLLWALLALAATAVVLAVWLDRTREDRALADQATIDRLAHAIASRPEFRSALSTSPEFRDATGRALEQALGDGELQRRWLSTDTARAVVAESAREAMVDQLQNGLLDDQLAARAAEVGDPEAQATAAQDIANLKAAWQQYEARVAELAQRVDDPRSSAELEGLQGELQALRSRLEGLATRVDCTADQQGNGPQTFLLKSRSTTSLPGRDIVVSLGRVQNDQIDSVSISTQGSADGPMNTRVIGGLPLGSPVRFDQAGRPFEAVFTYAQSRFLATALVGLELTPIRAAGATGC